MEDSRIFDRPAVRLHRDRAASRLGAVRPILDETASRLLDRLDDVTRRFERALDIGGRGVVAQRLRARGIETIACDLSEPMVRLSATPGPGSTSVDTVVLDEEWLPFAPHSFDLVVANMSLHWVDDLPGTLIQLRTCLRPDGLLLVSLPILPTLAPLRTALIDAEMAARGGVSARISPFPELRDCAALLQRAGFALPVADSQTIALSYADPLALLRDLRDAGEANTLRLRDRRTPPPALLAEAACNLPTDADGRVPMTLHMAVMTGWAPSPDQPKALRPGQATIRLEDALAAMPEADEAC